GFVGDADLWRRRESLGAPGGARERGARGNPRGGGCGGVHGPAGRGAARAMGAAIRGARGGYAIYGSRARGGEVTVSSRAERGIAIVPKEGLGSLPGESRSLA